MTSSPGSAVHVWWIRIITLILIFLISCSSVGHGARWKYPSWRINEELPGEDFTKEFNSVNLVTERHWFIIPRRLSSVSLHVCLSVFLSVCHCSISTNRPIPLLAAISCMLRISVKRWFMLIYISRLCYDVSVRLSVRLSVTKVHWRIIANLGFKFRSHFTAHCGRRAARRAACVRTISRHASQC